METKEQSKVEALLCTIASRQKIAAECRKEEQQLASQRNGAECEASNALIELAKQLSTDLGPLAAKRLTVELIRVTGYRPEVGCA